MHIQVLIRWVRHSFEIPSFADIAPIRFEISIVSTTSKIYVFMCSARSEHFGLFYLYITLLHKV